MATADAGYPHLICFSGNRHSGTDADGPAACADGLRQIIPLAEELGVTLCMELLNSEVDHPGYQSITRPGAQSWSSASGRTASGCSTTSTTCRSWKAT